MPLPIMQVVGECEEVIGERVRRMNRRERVGGTADMAGT